MTNTHTKQENLYRIINPCNRVIDLKVFPHEAKAIAWLRAVQTKRKDSFLELQCRVGRMWTTLPPPPKI